jgi:hypothetical protein
MAHRSIEETFQAIKPRGYRGIPAAPTIGVGVSSEGNLASSLSQAGQQISQLQSVYQNQAALIQANTQAIQGNTSAQASHSTAGSIASTASSFLGGGLGLLSPLISGIASLFGGKSAPPPLPIYVPPSPVQIDGALRASPAVSQTNGSAANGTPNTASGSSPSAATPNVTVNISAMDSQSFMDRSADIASAVREAMLNLHPINDVVANL